MMRRYEVEQDYSMERQQPPPPPQRPPPFRVLSPGGRILYEPQAVLRSPPPTRAPEPYKVAPQASSYGRTQRKSSFAIIAEGTRELGSRPDSGNQLPGSGRISPFRGRGFKGPPPRSHSRPQTPPDEPRQRSGRSRYDRRVSISQQNSPKRSQIPRPARSRSISASKDSEAQRAASPKFGRRATNRYTSSIENNNPNHRRLSQKDSKARKELSPIQGTPTKASTDRAKRSVGGKAGPRGFGAQRTAASSEKVNRNLLALPKNVPGGKRFITAKTPTPAPRVAPSTSTEALDSPSKIPLRRGSITGNAKTTANQSQAPLNNGEVKSGPETFKVISGKKKSSSSKDGVQTAAEEDLGLVDLLKQSSGATGTSSVVNTTTTTAVQPLQIDAASILGAEDELVAKLTSLEKKQKNMEIEEKSQDSEKSSSSRKPQESEAKTNPGQNQQPAASSGTNNSQGARMDTMEDKASSGANVKNGNRTQTMIRHFGPNAGNAGEEKGSSNSNNTNANSTANANVSANPNANANTNASSKGVMDQTKPAEGMLSATAEVEKSREDNKRSMEEQDKQRQAASSTLSHKKTDSKSSIARSSSKSTNSTNDSKKVSASSRANSATEVAAGADENDKTQQQSNRGKRNNETSLKSQVPAVSNESLGSLRSTDTGVSVNTVRGVSSAKEKTGLHLVKRPEEIETLSGNIMHLDRNGDHQLASEGAAAGLTAAGTRWQRLRSRWWKRLGIKVPGTEEGAEGTGEKAASRLNRCRGCWPKMRCLACRRDPKAQLWPGKQARANASSTVQLTADNRQVPLTKWARIKDVCRCARLREGRLCSWRSVGRRRLQQVAPAEQPSRSCCGPSERGLGGLCLGLFSRCGCGSCPCRRRKSDQPQRTRTVRAKHSLTSVAAPPLSEETKPKIPDVLVEHNSVMRGAIPCLPVPIAWFCLIWNVVLPGSGTIFSGLFNICLGQPRFSAVASPKARFGALIVNIIVGVSQLFTVLFCLVGWGWSIWWGVTMIRLARKYKRFKDSEAAANDPEARGGNGPETATLPAPGVPTQALRGMERTR